MLHGISASRISSFVAAAALLASCSLIVDSKLEGKKTDGGAPRDVHVLPDRGTGAPAVDLVVQTPFAYPGEAVVVAVNVSGFALVPPGDLPPVGPGAGHFRLTLEGEVIGEPVFVYEGIEREVKFPLGPPLLPDLPAGVYKLVVQLVHDDGTPLQPDVRDAEPLFACTRDPWLPQPAECPATSMPIPCAPQDACELVCPGGSCQSCYYVPECTEPVPCVRFSLIEPVKVMPPAPLHVAVQVGPIDELVDPESPEPTSPHTAYLRLTLRSLDGGAFGVLYEGGAPDTTVDVPPVPPGYYDLYAELIATDPTSVGAVLAEACWPLLLGQPEDEPPPPPTP